MKNKGFTLIELIVYMALFSIMMGGLIVIVFQLIQSSEKLSSKDTAQEEINFVLKKIDWALTGATSSSVVVDTSKISFNNIQSVIINLSAGNDIQITINGVINTLTTKNVKVTNLLFQYDSSKKLVSAQFTINDNVTNFTKYLRL